MCGRQEDRFKTFDLSESLVRHFGPVYPYIEEVTLHGWGEGTLHPNFAEILKFLNKYPLLRKYFVTNGSTLPRILDAIFDHNVDLVSVSIDGATAATNDAIRRGGRLDREVASIKKLLAEKKKRNLDYPYVNLVFTGMQKNISEFPELISLAGSLELPEVKFVYLTVFEEDLLCESLMDSQEKVKRVFDQARKRAEKFGINLKVPEIQGQDEADAQRHKFCSFPWRDLYVGSDGCLRPCQSSAEKLGNIMEYKCFDDLWNSEKMENIRRTVAQNARCRLNRDNVCPPSREESLGGQGAGRSISQRISCCHQKKRRSEIWPEQTSLADLAVLFLLSRFCLSEKRPWPIGFSQRNIWANRS
jgi:MoaA/NifB/PqqE/SkfB family radical SAM enzyme